MEEDIQNSEAVRQDEEEESAVSEPPHVKEKKVEHETEEEKTELEFTNELQTILEKLKGLSSEASELKMPSVPRDVKDIYSKVCKSLKVSENSTFYRHAEEEKMDFSYQCLGSVGITAVSKALTTCKFVRSIDLKYNKLGAESLPAISSLLDQNENITHLNLQSNGIGKGSASMLSELISHCFSVEFLDLSNNNLGDEELQEIGIALMKIDCVKELNLSRNDFSSAKAQIFGSSISKCSALLKLDMSCCHLEEGAKFIFAGLKISNLTVLNLARNGIPNDAATALALGLRTNKSLQELDISYNSISNAGAKILAPGLKRSSTLEVMNLAHNPIQGSTAASILNSAGGNLKVLDLSGIRVNLAFFKTLRNYAKSGRDIKVLFGSEIRYECVPKDFKVLDESSLTKGNVLSYIESLAEEKGLSLRNVLKNIHASLIAERHAAALAEKEAQEKDGKKGKDEKEKKNEKDEKKKGKGEKKGKDEKKEIKDESSQGKDETKRLDMSVEEFARGLSNSPLALSKGLASEIGELLSEDGFVNMWALISRVKWRPDDLYVKIKAPKKPEPDKAKAKGKKK